MGARHTWIAAGLLSFTFALVSACTPATDISPQTHGNLVVSRHAGLPGIPRNVHWTKNVAGCITVTWQEPLNSGGSPVIRYDIYPGYYGGTGFEPEGSTRVAGRTHTVVFKSMDRSVRWAFAVAATSAASQGLPSRLQVETDGGPLLEGQDLVESWLEVISAPGQYAYLHGYGDERRDTPRPGVLTFYWKGPVLALIKALVAAVPGVRAYYEPSRYSLAEVDAASNGFPLGQMPTHSGVAVELNGWSADPVRDGIHGVYWPAGQSPAYAGPFPGSGEVSTWLALTTGTRVAITMDASPPGPTTASSSGN